MEPTAPSDSELVAQTLAGNREAFGQLYDRYARLVRAVVGGVSGDWIASDDMVQECFLRGYRNLPKLRDPARFGPWMVGIARQVGRERKRTVRKNRHEYRDPLAVEIGQSFSDEAEVDDRDELTQVMQKLAELPERERLVIHAFFLEQKNAQAAAGLLGLSRSGFYALLQRGIGRLSAMVQSLKTQKAKKR
jgi:RNA polymerase sigma factor (sigma-70 family)